jgi:hypothetical protein
MGKVPTEYWLRQFPDGQPKWGPCEFLFDPEVTDYDWLVVYDDLPPVSGERFSNREERLPCPRNNSLLITTEPSSIKSYGSAYVGQFGHVLTSQEPWALKHPNRIYAQPAMQWFYGIGSDRQTGYNQLAAATADKKYDVSTVCSNKKQRHTLHQRRYDFTQELKAMMPELEIFGRGVRAVDDKAEAIDPYRYHITIENQIAPHHWTEKLADAFLGFSLPLYYGCPNAADYFPEESFIPIDIYDTEGTCEIIRKAIRDNAYEKRLPHIIEARRRVLEEYNIGAVLAREITTRHSTEPGNGVDTVLARHALRRRHPLLGIQAFFEKVTARAIYAIKQR